LPIIFTFLATASAYASTQAHLVQVVQQAPTTTSVESPSGVALATQGIPLAIRVVAPNGLVVPDGTVVLSDGSTVISSISLVAGTATMTEVFSLPGTHQLAACYSGDINFLPSCSTSMPLTAMAPYVLKQTEPSATIVNAASFADELSVIPAKGFVGVVQLGCQAPSGQCSISPSSISFTGDGKPQMVKASLVPPVSPAKAGFFVLPLITFVGFRTRQKLNRARFLALLLVTTMLFGLAGCGPNLFVPINTTNLSMQVDALSGAYSQSVTYQIQVDTDVAK
jgi:hypothetical protein